MAGTDKLETQTDVDELIESVTRSLEDDDRKVRGGVIRRLGEIGDIRAVEPLIKALGGQNKNLRQGAVEALVKIGESAVDPLIKALGGKDESMRRRAVEALGKIGDPEAERLSLWSKRLRMKMGVCKKELLKRSSVLVSLLLSH